MVRTLWFEAVVELPDGQWLAGTSDHELWLLAPATGPDTPHTGEGYVAPTDDWEVADPPTRAYARRVLTALYERLFDLQVGARAAQTNGLSRAERDRLEAQVASLYVPELVDHEFERLLEDDSDRLRRSPGRVGISDVSVVASTHHCLEVEATIDFTPAVRTEDGRQPTQYRFALIRQDASSANPTGWVLTSTFSDEGC